MPSQLTTMTPRNTLVARHFAGLAAATGESIGPVCSTARIPPPGLPAMAARVSDRLWTLQELVEQTSKWTHGLRRFWFKFGGHSDSPLGYGVTAWTEDDACAILSQQVFEGRPLPPFEIRQDVDVRALDAKHIAPNMAD